MIDDLTHFQNWVDQKDYDNLEHYNLKGDSVLIDIYVYVPEVKKKVKIFGLSNEDLSTKIRTKVTTIAKVLKVSDNLAIEHKEGEFVSIPDYMKYSMVNPDFLKWQEAMKERPAPEEKQMPPKIIGNLNEWRRYRFELDKFSNNQNTTTYVIPSTLLKTSIDIHGLIESEMARRNQS